jgi:hypothetical protein
MTILFISEVTAGSIAVPLAQRVAMPKVSAKALSSNHTLRGASEPPGPGHGSGLPICGTAFTLGTNIPSLLEANKHPEIAATKASINKFLYVIRAFISLYKLNKKRDLRARAYRFIDPAMQYNDEK